MNEKELIKESKLILKQYYLGCLAHASYLIADEEAKTAVVVDPQRDIEQYLEDAKQRGLRITHVSVKSSSPPTGSLRSNSS